MAEAFSEGGLSGETLPRRGDRPRLTALLGANRRALATLVTIDDGYDEVVGRNGWTAEDEIVETLVDYADAVNDAAGITDRNDYVLNLQQARAARAKLAEAGFADEKRGPGELNELIYDRIDVQAPSAAVPVTAGVEFAQPDAATLQRLADGLRNL